MLGSDLVPSTNNIIRGKTAFSVQRSADRTAALGTNFPEKRAEIARLVREAYRIRARRALTALAPPEEKAVRRFIQHAYLVSFKALKGINDFQSVPQFGAAIDVHERQSAAAGAHAEATA